MVSTGKSVLVLGSLNANPGDRTNSRREIYPAQILRPDGAVMPVRWLSEYGELGISSMAFSHEDRSVAYMATETEVFELDLAAKKIIRLGIEQLEDLHEIAIQDGTLLVANTKYDEVVRFDPKTRSALGRVRLRRSAIPELPLNAGDEVVDTFHCNQAFIDLEGKWLALVHHTSGRQIIQKVANKLIKKQGTGGVLSPDDGSFVPLNLRAPHNVRSYDGFYYVLDSGRFLLNKYDRRWTLVQSASTIGFGRGLDFDHDAGLLLVGVSATRKRYLDLIPHGDHIPNMVLFIALENLAVVEKVKIPAVEQINAVYVVNDTIAASLQAFDNK